MTYFDTDVLVHYFVAYAPIQHQQSKKVVEKAMTDGLFYISQLSMQELAHTTFPRSMGNRLKLTNRRD